MKVAVCGANGKMGKEVVKMVQETDSFELVATIDCKGAQFESIEEASNTLKIDVLVDFTIPDSVYTNAITCLKNGIRPVIGTTGLGDEQLKSIELLAKEKTLGCLIAPNFSIGAILAMEFAQKAAKYFDNAEILEMHHNQKKDAPSGTAIKTAQLMSKVKKVFDKNDYSEIELLEGARGGESYSNIRIHSVRLPGFLASQAVIFGADGQILTIRHDTTSRACYMLGVKLAIDYVYKNNEFVWGLEHIL